MKENMVEIIEDIGKGINTEQLVQKPSNNKKEEKNNDEHKQSSK